MNTILTLCLIAALVWFGVPVFLAGCWFADRRRDRAEAAERAAQGRLVDVAFFAGLADETTPVYERLCFEQWEAEL